MEPWAALVLAAPFGDDVITVPIFDGWIVAGVSGFKCLASEIPVIATVVVPNANHDGSMIDYHIKALGVKLPLAISDGVHSGVHIGGDYWYV